MPHPRLDGDAAVPVSGPVAARVRIWRARRQRWDSDIIRGLGMPVPRTAQDWARNLVEQRGWTEAITEIREATGYGRRDPRFIALALMYGWKIPTPMPGRPRRRRSRGPINPAD